MMAAMVAGARGLVRRMPRRSTRHRPALPPASASARHPAAGLGRYQPSAFRIGHMGDIREADVAHTLAVLGDVLAGLRAGPAESAVSTQADGA